MRVGDTRGARLRTGRSAHVFDEVPRRSNVFVFEILCVPHLSQSDLDLLVDDQMYDRLRKAIIGCRNALVEPA